MRFIEYLQEQALLLEARIDFLKQHFKGISTAHDETAEHQDSDAIVDHFANNADPSPTKKHTQWILGLYQKGLIKQSDHEDIKETLTNFEKHHRKLDNRQLNQYQTLDHLQNALAPHLDDFASNRERKKAIKDDGSEVIHNQGGVVVRHIKTEKAACLYGRGTDWCTAYTDSDTPNQFNRYNREGPVYIIHHNNRKYQFHHPSAQFMDESDAPVTISDLHPDIQKSLITATHPDIQHLNLKYGNPLLTADHLEKAVKSSDYNIRASAYIHPNATKEMLDAGIKDESDNVRAAISYRSPNLTSEHLHTLLRDENEDVAAGVLARQKVTSDHIDTAMRHPHEYVRYKAIINPAVKDKHISDALDDPSEWVRARAASVVAWDRPNSDHMTKALNDTSKEVRRSALSNGKNPALTPDHVTNLLKNHISEAEWVLYHDTAVTPEHLTHILTSPESTNSAKEAALRHSKVTPDHIILGLNVHNEDVQQTALQQGGRKAVQLTDDHYRLAMKSQYRSINSIGYNRISKLTKDELEAGLNHPDFKIQQAIMRRPDADEATLRIGLKHPMPSVKMAAWDHPNTTKQMKDEAGLKYY